MLLTLKYFPAKGYILYFKQDFNTYGLICYNLEILIESKLFLLNLKI